MQLEGLPDLEDFASWRERPPIRTSILRAKDGQFRGGVVRHGKTGKSRKLKEINAAEADTARQQPSHSQRKRLRTGILLTNRDAAGDQE